MLLLHHQRTCFALQAGVLPSSEAICAIPNALVALCLNTFGLERVRSTHVLNVFIRIFTSKRYMKALGTETPAILGSGFEELFRFVPSLRTEGIDAIVAVFKALCILGGGCACIAFVKVAFVWQSSLQWASA